MHELYEGSANIYVVQEYLSGGELFDTILAKGHYSEKDASTMFHGLLSALEYLHGKNIMHRHYETLLET